MVEAPPTTEPNAARRYEPREELGRGGWGTVVRARDNQLQRDVAVKRIHAELVANDAIRERFCNEARVTAALQHPGVAPVHELGVDGKGAPFYVMKLLEGPTLREAIQQAHEGDTPPLAGYSLELLERFIDVCHTVACAHQQRVIHRDLKPSNILVGRFGETIVVDWGLAKRLDDTPEPPPSECVEATLAPGSSGGRSRRPGSSTRREGSNPSATRMGSVLGTPAYMSPEQARGEVDALNEATDIYALGVILYESLTGENPFRSDDVETTLHRVRTGDFRQPRAVNPRVPRALAAICQAAMSHKPENRYATAEEIVDDLRRFLAGEAVSVAPDPWWAKLQRWRRRRPALTAGLLGSALVLFVSSLVFGAVIHRAHEAEKLARQQAEQAHRDALVRLADAREAGDSWLIGLSGELEFYPGMEDLRGGLLQRAVTHYEGLTAGLEPADAAEALEAARLDIRLGDLKRLLGENDAAIERYQAADATLSGAIGGDLASDFHDDLCLEQVNARVGLALAGDPIDLEAEAAWLAGHSDSVEPRFVSAGARLVLARFRRGDFADDEAIDWLEAQQRAAAGLVASRGEPCDHQLLQTVRDALAGEYEQAGRLADAARVWRDELARLDARIDVEPGRPDLLQSRAYARMRLAGDATRLAGEREATAEYLAAVDDLQTAWRLSDADAFYRRNVAAAHANLGRSTPDEALAESRLAEAVLQLREAVAAEGPSADDLARLAACYESLGDIASRRGDPEATGRYDRAAECYTILSDHGLLTPELTARRARNLAGRSRLRFELGAREEAAEDLARAGQLVEVALRSSDDELVPRERQGVERLAAQIDAQRAGLLEGPAAEANLAKAMGRLRRLAEAELTDADEAYPLAAQQLIDLLIDQEPTPESIAEADGWLARIERASGGRDPGAGWRQRRALVDWLLGKPSDAEAHVRLALELRPGDPVSEALQARLAGGDGVDERLAAIRDAAPGDARLRAWVRRFAKPQG